MSIKYIFLVSRQAKIRLVKWYVTMGTKEKTKVLKEVSQLVLARKPKQCNFIEHQDTKVVYRKYASLFFVAGIELDDNELLMLEIIHRYVEVLDRFFHNVCELDLIFQFQKAYFILDEMIMAGELQESSKKAVIKVIAQQDETEAREGAERGWGDIKYVRRGAAPAPRGAALRNTDAFGVARTAMLTVQELKQSFARTITKLGAGKGAVIESVEDYRHQLKRSILMPLHDLRPNEMRSVLAVVTRVSAVKKSQGTDYVLSLQVADPTVGYDSSVLVSIFRRSAETMPDVRGPGDILYLESAKTELFGGQCHLCSNFSTCWQ
ncbi:hypothetical protein IWQ56_005777, partial [Coemansia nantahalensis]